MKDVLTYPNKFWDWEYLSANPGIAMKDVLAYPDKPWYWGRLSANPSITLEDVLAHPDKPWNWNWLSGNRFLYHPALQSRAIKKLTIIRAKHRNKTMTIILKSSAMYNDLITTISSYG